MGGLLQVPQDAAWAASKRLPLWCSEMGPALPRRTMPKWAVPDSWASWNAAVGKVVAESPDLRMWGYYYDPAHVAGGGLRATSIRGAAVGRLSAHDHLS